MSMTCALSTQHVNMCLMLSINSTRRMLMRREHVYYPVYQLNTWSLKTKRNVTLGGQCLDRNPVVPQVITDQVSPCSRPASLALLLAIEVPAVQAPAPSPTSLSRSFLSHTHDEMAADQVLGERTKSNSGSGGCCLHKFLHSRSLL